MEEDVRENGRSPPLNPWLVWGGPFLFLLLGIFGFKGTFLMLLVLVVTLLGLYAACQASVHAESDRYLSGVTQGRAHWLSSGVPRWEKETLKNNQLPKADIRMTGSAVVDEPLHDIIQYCIRDFIQTWYSPVSPDQEFLNGLHQLTRRVAVSFASRTKDVDWVSYMTKKLVEDVINHLRLFKVAQSRQEALFLTIQTAGEEIPSLIECFFEQELASESGRISRDRVCKDPLWEKKFLRELTDVLLYSLLPSEDFRVKSLRYLLRELLVSSVLLPMIELFSDPDYVNQTVIWMCKSVPVSSDAFLTSVRTCNDVDELEAVREKVKAEISSLRSKDSGGNMDAEIKRQLSSVLYVQKVLEERTKWLKDGKRSCDLSGLDWTRLPESVRCINLPLEDVLSNDVAVSFFLEFLHGNDLQHHLYLYLSAERWKMSAAKALVEIRQSSKSMGAAGDGHEKRSPSTDCRVENLRGPALRIFQQFLSDKAPQRVKLDERIVHSLYQRLQFDEEPKESWFDSLQVLLKEKFLEDPYLPSFKRSQLYVKLLAEMDLLKDGLAKSDDEDAVSMDDDLVLSDTGSICSMDGAIASNSRLSPSMRSASADETSSVASGSDLSKSPSSLSGMEDRSSVSSKRSIETSNPVILKKNQQQFTDDGSTLYVEIRDTRIVKEMPKSYAMYTVYAKRIPPPDAEKQTTMSNPASPGTQRKSLGIIEWTVDRRYSDFYDFHNIVRDNFGDLADVYFPGKKAFNNLRRNFLGERKQQLNQYLQSLVRPEVIKQHPGLRERLYQFLGEGSYIQRNIVERRVMDPLKSMKNVILSAPETIRAKIDEMTHAAPKAVPASNRSVPGGAGAGGREQVWENPVSAEFGKFVWTDPWTLDGDDAVHMRILLVVLEEIFNVRDATAWRLRPRLVSALRHLLQAMFGNIYNRKLRQYLQWATSYEQVAHYLRTLRNNFWPNGSLALPNPPREKCVKKRTEIAAKAALLSFIPDDLKNLLGTETTRHGILRVYELFQYATLNRRLVYVFLEGIFEVLFPANQLGKVFQKYHCQSQLVAGAGRSHRRGGSRDLNKSPSSRWSRKT